MLHFDRLTVRGSFTPISLYHTNFAYLLLFFLLIHFVLIPVLNWRTDCTAGTAEQHLGSVFTDTYGNIVSEEAHKISAYLDENTKALVVSGVNPEKYYVPALSQLFLPGNYHVVELNFFYRNLQQNVKSRAANYFARQPDQYMTLRNSVLHSTAANNTAYRPKYGSV